MSKTNQIPLMNHEPLKELSDFTRKVAGETVLLLKNENNVLPIHHKKVAVFGRIQTHYYKSGTGSGGLVNVKDVPSIIESLYDHPLTQIDQRVYSHYQSWIEKNPYDAGNGQWASEPWAQEEMVLDDQFVEMSAKSNDCAIVIFGRTAGEDKDCFNGEGSYLLSQLEEKLLKQVTTYYKQVVVVLNIGNMIDLGFLDKYKIDGLLIAWHGGMYGAHALTDCLTGLVTPSAKLPMTVVKNLKDIPSNDQFGQPHESIYTEDIYVGYRYFETFNQDAVRYPFGYGLSYTKFSIKNQTFEVNGTQVKLSVRVQNIGKFSGKEVIQVYAKMPQGILGKPAKVLTAFSKTVYLSPNAAELITFNFDLKDFASYDDLGQIKKSAYILEKGLYQIYVGSDVRSIKLIGSFRLNDDIITQSLTEKMAPLKAFNRLKPTKDLRINYEAVPLRTLDYNNNIKNEMVEALTQSDDNYNLFDVYKKNISMDTFIGTLSVDDMIELSRGEGMSSPKVTAGTAAAFGGVTTNLLNKGIPISCAADGPSGIRMDSGAYASSLPSGTALASSFNLNMVEELYLLLGTEMRGYAVDTLLGPGMNIQRHPLNGRNFEYFSEDPLLTGMMASSYVKGLHKAGVDGTLKHLACNNQETDRFNVDAIVSERALREIYLKGFEIAVKYADAKAIMTSYNPVNGLWSASNYELTKNILRDEWGFNGVVMTDWWAKMNDYQQKGSKSNTKAMIISQNDLYMVVSDSKSNSSQDNAKAAFNENLLTLAQLQTTTRHILDYLIHTPAFYRLHRIDFKLRDYQHSTIFDTQSNMVFEPAILDKLPLINETLSIAPYQTHIHLSDDKIVSNNKDLILNKNATRACIKVQTTTDLTVYDIFASKPMTNVEDLKPIDHNHLIDISGNNWDKVNLEFNQLLSKNESIRYDNDLIYIIDAKATFEYGLMIQKPGKYIFEIEIKVDATELAQVPFSIFVDNIHKATLTLRTTNNTFILTKAFIIMDAGIHRMKFKFNQGGMIIKTIHVIKHG